MCFIKHKYIDRNIKNKGFTLVELLIVVAIIAILAAIAIPAFNKYLNRVRITSLKNDLRNAYIASQSYLLNTDNNVVNDVNILYNYGFRKTKDIDLISVNIQINSGSIVLVHKGLDLNIVDTNVGIVNYKQEYSLPRLK